MANFTDDRDRDLEMLKLWAEGRSLGRSPIEIPTISSDYDLVSHPFFDGLNDPPLPANPLELFRNPMYHEHAVGRILTYCSDQSGFIPANGLEGQAHKYPEYINRVSTFPGFYVDFNRQSARMQASNDISLMIRDILSVYNGVLDADVLKILTSVVNMSVSIANSSHARIKDSIFTQMAIVKKNGNLYTSMFYATLAMEVNKQGKKTYRSQQYYVNRVVFRVSSAFLTDNAAYLSILLGLGSWGKTLRDMTSPTDGSKTSCFQEHFENASVTNILATIVAEH